MCVGYSVSFVGKLGLRFVSRVHHRLQIPPEFVFCEFWSAGGLFSVFQLHPQWAAGSMLQRHSACLMSALLPSSRRTRLLLFMQCKVSAGCGM